jgi:hypothetical protein
MKFDRRDIIRGRFKSCLFAFQVEAKTKKIIRENKELFSPHNYIKTLENTDKNNGGDN